jgi:hypothetical protein
MARRVICAGLRKGAKVAGVLAVDTINRSIPVMLRLGWGLLGFFGYATVWGDLS